MVEGVSGLIGVARRYRRKLGWEPSLGRLKWPNGSQAQLFSGDNADGLRGPEFDFGWADELAKWREADSAWDNLQMALRRGPRARALVTTTPRPMKLLERIRDGKWTVTTSGRTSDNINLDDKFIEVMTATYGGTRVGAQELDGVLLKDVGTQVVAARQAAIANDGSGAANQATVNAILSAMRAHGLIAP